MTGLASVAPDKGRAADQAHAVFAQLCALLRDTDDLSPGAVGHWTAGDVAAHLAGLLALYPRLLSGGASPAGTVDAIAAMNEQLVADVPERDGPALATRIESAAAAFADAVRAVPGDPEVGWHAGLRVPLSSLASLMVEEASVHGYDIARAVGRPWHIRDEWAHTTFRGLLPIMPAYVSDRGARMRPGSTSGCAATRRPGRSSPSPTARSPSSPARRRERSTATSPRRPSRSCW